MSRSGNSSGPNTANFALGDVECRRNEELRRRSAAQRAQRCNDAADKTEEKPPCIRS
jgi:hypothetical protein